MHLELQTLDFFTAVLQLYFKVLFLVSIPFFSAKKKKNVLFLKNIVWFIVPLLMAQQLEIALLSYGFQLYAMMNSCVPHLRYFVLQSTLFHAIPFNPSKSLAIYLFYELLLGRRSLDDQNCMRLTWVLDWQSVN